jgi:hypothetical protein
MGDFRVKVGDGLRLSVLAAMGLLCVGLGGVTVARAQDVGPKTMLAMPPAPLLPQTLGKLTRVAEGDAGDGLGKLDAADAAVLTEDGLRRFARSEYKDGAQAGTVTVYKFMDASGAVAAFDYFRRPGAAHLDPKLADAAASDGDGVVFRKGVNVVRENFNLHGDHVDALTKELADHLPKVGGTAALAPLLPTMLPEKGLDAESVKYALGPAGYQAMGGVLPPETVGFDKSAETVTAKYKGGGVLTLLLYPTPQIAGEHDRTIESQLGNDGGAGTVKLRREGPLVLLTTGAWTPAAAQTMVDGIHLHMELSFDKPMPHEFHAEMQKTYSLLTSIMVFCGVGALAALVLGLFLGGGRAAIRVMQGKPAASEPEFLRIDLRGPVGKRAGDNPEA